MKRNVKQLLAKILVFSLCFLCIPAYAKEDSKEEVIVQESPEAESNEAEEGLTASPSNAEINAEIATPSNSSVAPGDEEAEEMDETEGVGKEDLYASETEVILPKPSRKGYRFVEWNTEKDGSGDSYHVGEIIEITDMTLYAIWEECETLTVYATGGNFDGKSRLTFKEGVELDEEDWLYDYYLSEDEIELPEPEKEGYEFLYYSDSRDGDGEIFYAGEVIEITDMKLYAIWEEPPEPVTPDEEEEEETEGELSETEFSEDETAADTDDITALPDVDDETEEALIPEDSVVVRDDDESAEVEPSGETLEADLNAKDGAGDEEPVGGDVSSELVGSTEENQESESVADEEDAFVIDHNDSSALVSEEKEETMSEEETLNDISDTTDETDV